MRIRIQLLIKVIESMTTSLQTLHSSIYEHQPPIKIVYSPPGHNVYL